MPGSIVVQTPTVVKRIFYCVHGKFYAELQDAW